MWATFRIGTKRGYCRFVTYNYTNPFYKKIQTNHAISSGISRSENVFRQDSCTLEGFAKIRRNNAFKDAAEGG